MCSVEDRKLFHTSHCLLLISIGSKNHEDNRFQATIDLVNKSFNRCTILVGDTLHRHNLIKKYPQLPDKEIHLKCLDMGESWTQRNHELIRRLDIPYEINYWDKWLKHPEFADSLLKIEDSYNKNDIFKNYFDIAVKEYLDRNISFNDKIDSESCLYYLKEECAAMILWAASKYDFEVYPSGRNSAMFITYEYLIKPTSPHTLKSVALRFKK